MHYLRTPFFSYFSTELSLQSPSATKDAFSALNKTTRKKRKNKIKERVMCSCGHRMQFIRSYAFDLLRIFVSTAEAHSDQFGPKCGASCMQVQLHDTFIGNFRISRQ